MPQAHYENDVTILAPVLKAEIEMLKQEVELLKDRIAVEIDAAEIDAKQKKRIAQGAMRVIKKKESAKSRG